MKNIRGEIVVFIDKIIEDEKDRYGKLFSEVSLDQELVLEFLSESERKQRTYLVKGEVLKNYIGLIEDIERYNENHKIGKYVKAIKNINSLKRYKLKNSNTIEQLSECSECTCLHCNKDCPFKACLGCSDKSYIVKCDKVTLNVRAHQNYKINIQNNRTRENGMYSVLFTLKDCKKGDMYIVLQSPKSDEKVILNYYPNIDGDTYGEIKDTVVFDTIVSTIKVIA